jgi:hypothetical protein
VSPEAPAPGGVNYVDTGGDYKQLAKVKRRRAPFRLAMIALTVRRLAN